MDVSRCCEALKNFAGKRVLVIGDLMLDEHIWGTVGRISPEAPVMVVEVDSSTPDFRPGGAANVANNIRALGAEASVIGVIGDDEGGRILLECLEGRGIDTSGVLVDSSRPTTRKTRIWASHRHQVVRVDREAKHKIPATLTKSMVSAIADRVAMVDAVLLSDYAKGVINRETAQAAVRIANEFDKPSVSNPKPCNLSYFVGVGTVTLNQSEASVASGIEISEIPDIERAGYKLLDAVRCQGLIITRGAHGLTVFERDSKVRHIPAIESEVYDVAGAGDTVVSALTLAIASGLSLAEAGIIANCSGGAVVRKVGVATTNLEEIASLLKDQRFE